MRRFVIMFKPEFVSKIADGSKPHTIRPVRKGERQIQVGDTLSLRHWSGKPYEEGTNHVVIREVVCMKVSDILIEQDVFQVGDTVVYIDGKHLDDNQRSELAKHDGFSSFAEMLKWFEKTHGLPFTGRLIEWGV